MVTSTMQSNTENLRGNPSRKTAKPKIAKVGIAAKRKAKAKSGEGLSAKIYRQGRDAVSSVYDSASKAGARASRAMPDLRDNFDVRARGQSLYTTMEEHPLVIGAVGLGIGMVLAALLPSTHIIRHKR